MARFFYGGKFVGEKPALNVVEGSPSVALSVPKSGGAWKIKGLKKCSPFFICYCNTFVTQMVFKLAISKRVSLQCQ
jgi:hypothetical protein